MKHYALLFAVFFLAACHDRELAPVGDGGPGNGGADLARVDTVGQPMKDAASSVPDMKPSVPGKWVTIKAGTFLMGSPQSEKCRKNGEGQHRVTLTNSFEIMTTEVTQAHFEQVMGYNPSRFKGCGATCPVEQVSWHEAAAYANMLSSIAGKSKCYACQGSGKTVKCGVAVAYTGKKFYTCPGYRLPTEAEWEYSYRASTNTPFYNGSVTNCDQFDSNADKIGWYYDNSKVSYTGNFSGMGPNPSGRKAPNSSGLYDMAGNVWEWCHDWYAHYPSSAVTDPLGQESASYRVMRGGSWGFSPGYLRAAQRKNNPSTSGWYGLGFRCARTRK